MPYLNAVGPSAYRADARAKDLNVNDVYEAHGRTHQLTAVKPEDLPSDYARTVFERGSQGIKAWAGKFPLDDGRMVFVVGDESLKGTQSLTYFASNGDVVGAKAFNFSGGLDCTESRALHPHNKQPADTSPAQVPGNGPRHSHHQW